MKRVRLLILLTVVILSGLLAFGVWTRPQAQRIDANGFSAERVVSDIKNIAHSFHSVAHPVEHANVRDYLVGRLESLGADTVRLFEYKGLEGPENRPVKYKFDAVNVLAEFAPHSETESYTNLLFVAHYDSRYPLPIYNGDTISSYGAADDGYGLGIILEAVSQVLEYREQWKQGVKVLFTDAEEVRMAGMKAMWENNREEFNDVGLAVNIEARGPWGPALLFETSGNNGRVMQLYADNAKSPFTYSLTTVVYNFMPNYTDFTVIKDDIPGLNFSTIADINHYHNELDNIDNVDTKTIQHYAAQIMPVVKEYLCGDKYADKDYLRANESTTSFTIPLLGLFNFSKTAYMWLNIAIFVIFLGLFSIDALRGRFELRRALCSAPVILLLALAVFAAGLLATYLCCLVTGVPFKPFGTIQGVSFDNVAMVVLTAIMVVAVSVPYAMKRHKGVAKVASSLRANAKSRVAGIYAATRLYTVLLLLFVLSAVLLFALGENIMFFIPLAVSVLAMLLYRITHLELWLLLAVGVVLLYAFSFLYALAMALTIGAYAVVLMLAFLDTLVLLPLVDLYLTPKNGK